MIIRGTDLETDPARGRTAYPVAGRQTLLHHLSVYDTLPERPFNPHKHEFAEVWYIVEGHATVTLDGQEHTVGAGDVVILEPWVEHGLRTESRAQWICLG